MSLAAFAIGFTGKMACVRPDTLRWLYGDAGRRLDVRMHSGLNRQKTANSMIAVNPIIARHSQARSPKTLRTPMQQDSIMVVRAASTAGCAYLHAYSMHDHQSLKGAEITRKMSSHHGANATRTKAAAARCHPSNDPCYSPSWIAPMVCFHPTPRADQMAFGRRQF